MAGHQSLQGMLTIKIIVAIEKFMMCREGENFFLITQKPLLNSIRIMQISVCRRELGPISIKSSTRFSLYGMMDSFPAFSSGFVIPAIELDINVRFSKPRIKYNTVKYFISCFVFYQVF